MWRYRYLREEVGGFLSFLVFFMGDGEVMGVWGGGGGGIFS